MSPNWTPYPPRGTMVLPGLWLCTVINKENVRRCEVLRLQSPAQQHQGLWLRQNGKQLPRGWNVIAIDRAPDPYQPTENSTP